MSQASAWRFMSVLLVRDKVLWVRSGFEHSLVSPVPVQFLWVWNYKVTLTVTVHHVAERLPPFLHLGCRGHAGTEDFKITQTFHDGNFKGKLQCACNYFYVKYTIDHPSQRLTQFVFRICLIWFHSGFFFIFSSYPTEDVLPFGNFV